MKTTQNSEQGSATRDRDSSECVSDGHPDKICDQISDAVLDACLAQDPDSRVAVEAAFKGHDVLVFGELTTSAKIDVPEIVRGVVADIGHGDGRWGIHPGRLRVRIRLTDQAPEISRAVGTRAAPGGELGAGDQGIVVGFACDETPEFMPLSYSLARRLMLRQRELRRTGEGAILGPDAKCLVSVTRDQGRPVCIDAVVLSSQHDPYASLEAVRELLMEEVVKRVIPRELCRNHTRICINPGGPFTEGGPIADAGLTGRKIVADAYGPRGGHGGGAFSGKDGTKVDRSGAYAARRLAREYVSSGAALVVKVTAIYAIGAADQLFADIELTPRPGSDGNRMRQVFFGDAKEMFRPSRLLADLGLTRPIFRQVATFGHFGRTDLDLPWEEPLGLLGEKGTGRPVNRAAGNRVAARAARVRTRGKDMK